jgi:hypothetical protein
MGTPPSALVMAAACGLGEGLDEQAIAVAIVAPANVHAKVRTIWPDT